LGQIDGLKVAMVGDLKYGRTVHSLTKLLVNYDVEFSFVSPQLLEMPADILQIVQSNHHSPEGHHYTILENLEAVIDVMNKAKEKMIVMHPLPRVNEISYTVDDDPRAAYFRQMQNGMYVRMALLAAVLGKA